MNEMVKDIRAEMDKILDKIDWMDDMTRERAKDKLRTMKEYIGYPEEILQENLLEELYEARIYHLVILFSKHKPISKIAVLL